VPVVNAYDISRHSFCTSKNLIGVKLEELEKGFRDPLVHLGIGDFTDAEMPQQ
jgi:hypothetical protein